MGWKKRCKKQISHQRLLDSRRNKELGSVRLVAEGQGKRSMNLRMKAVGMTEASVKSKEMLATSEMREAFKAAQWGKIQEIKPKILGRSDVLISQGRSQFIPVARGNFK